MVFNMSEEDRINCTINHDIHQYLFSSVYILVLLVGVPSNLYSLYHAALQLKQKNELGVYLMNLTVSDLLYLASLPLWLQYIFQGDDWQHKEWLCQVCGFLLYENIYITIGFLCCISLDRYLAVVHPLRFTSLRSMNAAWIASATIWMKEIAVGVVFFRHKELSKDRKNQSVCFEHYPMQPWEYNINFYRFSVGFVFPLAILSISYLCVLRAVGRSAGTQPDQKIRIRQLVSSTILIFLVCFSPYHVFLLVRTMLERDCNFIEAIFNYYHLSLLLTTLNCVADPALYCFVSESARHGLYKAIIRPVARLLCCCRRRGNASPTNPATDSHEVATDENNGYPTVTLITHTSNNVKTDSADRGEILITQTDEKVAIPLTVQNTTGSDNCVDTDGHSSCVTATEKQRQKTESTEEIQLKC
ncbi:ovarian cancer G-protein coupled receptor 1 [Anabas testudineus]|uniref:G-protein coupled receptors family 1 profile domain-containing protein n=1 Tax=Anabas testudineus TaxID=64144 RepID=A0A3Q1IMJ6_ANATE|nr:ovarian cancer G-protein coupled receptor 1 [Anabas testudineus]XP_026212339.1 ovarian cancer G-protein coupled receptor 1 [Anabas testudineus]XP_026212340.1 ovarian cancer G-protein coupled receptor 1 [Anabas testudineus]